MNKESSIGDLERSIYQITIADLANYDKTLNNKDDDEIIEFEDVKISYKLFKHCFYDNNYEHFDLNIQSKYINEISINNKIIKQTSLYKNYVGGAKINIIDILILKYIENKKIKLNDVTKISLIKDFNKYNSLLDFKTYKNNLRFDDVLNLFNHYENKNSKKYFRFKIKVTYYSDTLDETISMYFNYLVKIPKPANQNDTSNSSSSHNEEIDDENSIISDDSIIDTEKFDKYLVEYNESSFDEPILNNNIIKEVENIVYSNYIKKINDKNIIVNVIDTTNNSNELEENVSDDDNDDNDNNDDTTISSFEISEEDNPFF